MFSAPIAFLNDELKAELWMKSKKEEEEDDAKFFLIESLNGPRRQGLQDLCGQDQEVWHRNSRRIPEMEIGIEWTNEDSWIQWKLRHGYEFGPLNVGGTWFRSIFEWTAGPRKQNKTSKAKEQTEYNPQHIYDCAIFELEICAFDI
jgi:hypothetical protein